MIKLKLLSLALLGLVLGTACKPKNEVNAVTPSENSSLLWRIEKGGNTPSYLFGTMHIIGKDYYYFPEHLQQLILDADKVVLEIGKMPNAFELIAMMRSNDGNIFDKMSVAQRDSVYEFIDKELGKNPEKIANRLGGFKPFFLQQYLASAAFPKKYESYEQDIYKMQGKAKAPYVGLETIEEQLALFDGATVEEDIESIMATVRDIESAREEMLKMSVIHREGDVEAMYNLVNSSPEMEGMNLDDLLFKRNKNWIPKLVNILENETAFIAVGAGHLGGEQGVINLLRAEGYTLTPMNY